MAQEISIGPFFATLLDHDFGRVVRGGVQ